MEDAKRVLGDKVALVTGGGSGIGLASAELLGDHGAKLVISDISEENGQVAVKHLDKRGIEAMFVRADSSSPSYSEELVRKTLEEFGRLDIAVNNAGIGGPLGMTGEYPLDGWKRVMDINLSGVFYGLRY